MRDYFQVLGLTPSATVDEIKTAYRKLSKKFHPDMNDGDKFFEARFKEIQEAYDKLMDEKYRTAFNQQKASSTTTSSSSSTSQSSTKTQPPPKSPPPPEGVASSRTTNYQPPLNKTSGSNIEAKWVGIGALIVIGIIWVAAASSKKSDTSFDYSSKIEPALVPSEPQPSYTYQQTSAEPAPMNADSTIRYSDTTTQEPSNPFANYTNRELKNWLAEKLTQNLQNRTSCIDNSLSLSLSSTSCSHYNDYECRVDEDYLIIKSNYEDLYDEISFIPFYDFKYLYGKPYENQFSIYTNTESTIQIGHPTKKKSRTNHTFVGFKNNGEPDLLENIETVLRLLSAQSQKPTSEILPTFIPKSAVAKPSLEETKTWLLSKLKKYSKGDAHITLDGNNLVIVTGSDRYAHKATIPLCKCNIYQRRPSYGSYDFDWKSKIEFTTGLKLIESSTSYSGTTYRDSYELNIELEREENLLKRLQKALINFKEHCPAEQSSNEPY